MNTLFWIILLLFLLLIAGILFCYWWISRAANPYLYDHTEALPHRKTALLLGTAKYTSEGYLNPFFGNRVVQAIEVYKQKKVRKILISGADKIPRKPDEVDEMHQSMFLLGARDIDILEDHEGSRTWYAVLRCKTVHHITDPLIISQRFHNQRAVFIALKMGMQPVAINATEVTGAEGTIMILREALARVKCLMDCYLFKPQLPG